MTYDPTQGCMKPRWYPTKIQLFRSRPEIIQTAESKIKCKNKIEYNSTELEFSGALSKIAKDKIYLHSPPHRGARLQPNLLAQESAHASTPAATAAGDNRLNSQVSLHSIRVKVKGSKPVIHFAVVQFKP